MTGEHLIKNIHGYARFQVEEPFCTTQEQNIFKRLISTFTKVTHLALNGYWLEKYVRNALGDVGDCYIPKVVKCREIERLGKATVPISDEEQQSE